MLRDITLEWHGGSRNTGNTNPILKPLRVFEGWKLKWSSVFCCIAAVTELLIVVCQICWALCSGQGSCGRLSGTEPLSELLSIFWETFTWKLAVRRNVAGLYAALHDRGVKAGQEEHCSCRERGKHFSGSFVAAVLKVVFVLAVPSHSPTHLFAPLASVISALFYFLLVFRLFSL